MAEPILSPSPAQHNSHCSSSVSRSSSSRTLPAHLSASLSNTPRPQTHSLETLLQIFEAKKSPSSVTKLRHKFDDHQKMDTKIKPSVTYTKPDKASNFTKSLVRSPYSSSLQDPLGPNHSPDHGSHTNSKATSSDDFDSHVRQPVVDDPPAIEYDTTDRFTISGRPLRPRAVLSGPAGEQGVSYYHKGQPPRSAKTTPRRRLPKNSGDRLATLTERMQIRHEITTVTKAKADRFVNHYRELFLPLLPKENYITKLQLQGDAGIIPWVDIGQPEGINATLKPYQLTGLSFLVYMFENGVSAILGDEMGLGKTIQTLSLFQYLKQLDDRTDIFASKEKRPFLVVCPLVVLENWIAEAKKFTPDIKVLRLHGTVNERTAQKEKLIYPKFSRKCDQTILFSNDTDHARYDLVVTTYEAFHAEQSWFKRASAWRYVVLDEGHKIKNYKSSIAQSLQSLRAEYRVLLTGTPLQNSLVEMWSLLHWLFPDVFVDRTLDSFRSAFNLAKGTFDRKFVDQSRRLLELIMLRRTKDSPGINLGLPNKDVVRLFVPLTPMQRKWYLQMLTLEPGDVLQDIFKSAAKKEQDVIRSTNVGSRHFQSEHGRFLAQPLSSAACHQIQEHPLDASQGLWRRLLNLVVQLRKICTHPYLIPDACPQLNVIGSHVIEASGKFMALRKLVEELVLRQKRKILIFSGFTEILDWIEDLMTYVSEGGSRFKHIRFDGSTRRARRNLYVRLFQQATSAYKVMLISTRAGGIGINLAAATAAIFIDEDWNPQVDLQAEARCHRIGQSQPVTIYKLCAAGTVEEQMLGRIHKKLYLSAKIFESMESVHNSTGAILLDDEASVDHARKLFSDLSDFQSFLRHGTKTLASSTVEADEMMTWDFDKMINMCRRELLSDDVANTEASNEEQWLSTMERVECAIFDGQRYARKRVESKIPGSPLSRSNRRVGMETTVMVDGFAINKASLECGNWEAVPTIAGKDPSLKCMKRTKEIINHQSTCLLCRNQINDKQSSVTCKLCPRNFHAACLGTCAPKHKFATATWACAQHSCSDCGKKANDAGGMIFRCCTCIRGYCEDCLTWDKVELIGDLLDEYQVLGFGHRDEAYYIICSLCQGLESDTKDTGPLELVIPAPQAEKYEIDEITVPEPTIDASHHKVISPNMNPIASAWKSPYRNGSRSSPLFNLDDDSSDGCISLDDMERNFADKSSIKRLNDSVKKCARTQPRMSTPDHDHSKHSSSRSFRTLSGWTKYAPTRNETLETDTLSGRPPHAPDVPSQAKSHTALVSRRINDIVPVRTPSATKSTVPDLLRQSHRSSPPRHRHNAYKTPSSLARNRFTVPSAPDLESSPSSANQQFTKQIFYHPDMFVEGVSPRSLTPSTPAYETSIGQSISMSTPHRADMRAPSATLNSTPRSSRYDQSTYGSSSLFAPVTPTRTARRVVTPDTGSKRKGAQEPDESAKRRKQDRGDIEV